MSETKDIIFHGYVPRWMQRYCNKLRKLLIPEWTLVVRRAKKGEKIDPDPDVDGCVYANYQYLDAEIVFSSEIKDNVYGRREIVHEFNHLFLANLIMASKLSGQVRHRATTKHGAQAEEQTVVTLAKVIESLLNKIELSNK